MNRQFQTVAEANLEFRNRERGRRNPTYPEHQTRMAAGLRRPNFDLDGICSAEGPISEAEDDGVGAVVGVGMLLLNGCADLLGAGGRAVTE